MGKRFKRCIAVLTILMILFTAFPFTWRSFLQWFWAAVPLLILAVLWLLPGEKEGFLHFLEKVCGVYAAAAVVLFSCMALCAHLPAYDEPEVILIFGAEVRKDGLSPMLRMRCDKGFELSKLYPRAEVVVSGWQGPGDAANEGESMGEYLLGLGLDPGRLHVDSEASNTLENLQYSLKWTEGKTVAAVSDDFHLFRICVLGKGLGMKIQPRASSTSTWKGMRFWFREILALVWNLLRGAVDAVNLRAGHLFSAN